MKAVRTPPAPSGISGLPPSAPSLTAGSVLVERVRETGKLELESDSSGEQGALFP